MISKVIEQDIQEIYSEFESQLKNLQGKTILITGANGFIPSYIVDTLDYFNKNNEVPCKMILMNKNKIKQNSRLSHLIGNPNIGFISQDVGKEFEVLGKPEVILHAASRANPIAIFEEPLDTIDSNVNGTRTLLDYASKNNLENFIFFSSSEVYGDPTLKFLPTPEDYPGSLDCTSQMAAYSESKRFCETLCFSFFRKHNVPVKIPRIFHTYGPGIRNDGKTITSFFVGGNENKAIRLKDPGTAKRSYSYVSDTVRGIFNLWFNGESGRSYNVGDDTNHIPVRELAQKVGNLLGIEKIIIPEEKYVTDDRIKDRMPDISKLRALGFIPKTSLYEGLEKMKKHYDEIGYF